MQISAAYTKALAEGRRDGKGGLSPRTVHHMHRVLKQALAQAVGWQLLIRNPVEAVDPPKVERQRMTTYDMAQTAALIDAVRGTRIFIPVCWPSSAACAEARLPHSGGEMSISRRGKFR